MKAYRGITSKYGKADELEKPAVLGVPHQPKAEAQADPSRLTGLYLVHVLAERCKTHPRFEEDPICVMATEVIRMERELDGGINR